MLVGCRVGYSVQSVKRRILTVVVHRTGVMAAGKKEPQQTNV